MRARISNHDYENLSAYLDGQLTASEQWKLEERMRARPELKAVLEDLTQTRAMVRMMSHRRAPRAFTLTREMVGDIRPRRWQGFFSSLFPALSFASAVATLVLVATLIFELAPGVDLMPASQPQEVALKSMDGEPPVEGETEIMRAAPAAAEADPAGVMEAPQERMAVEDTAGSPPVITWNDSNAPQLDWYRMEGGIYAPAPIGHLGRGGGGGETGMYPGGSGGILPEGGLILPLEAVESVAGDRGPEAAELPAAEAERRVAEFARGGPILGLSAGEEAGQIEARSAFGQPLVTGLDERSEPVEGEQLATEATPAEDDPKMPPAAEEQPVDQSAEQSLRTVQALLALLAIITGAAAFLIYRKRA